MKRKEGNASCGQAPVQDENLPQKRCTKCGEVKPLDGFIRCRAARDGRESMCKSCSVIKRRRWKEENPDSHERARLKWRANNRRKEIAHRAVYKAIQNGKLVRPDACEECGRETKVQAHHEDYERRLDVQWLCPSCHFAKHYPSPVAALPSDQGEE